MLTVGQHFPLHTQCGTVPIQSAFRPFQPCWIHPASGHRLRCSRPVRQHHRIQAIIDRFDPRQIFVLPSIVAMVPLRYALSITPLVALVLHSSMNRIGRMWRNASASLLGYGNVTQSRMQRFESLRFKTHTNSQIQWRNMLEFFQSLFCKTQSFTSTSIGSALGKILV